MGKIKKFTFTTIIVIVAAWSIMIVHTKKEYSYNLLLSNIESLAGDENLPEVEITCGSSEHKGRCWDGDCEPFYTPFGFAKAWDCYLATGNPNDTCVDGAPCV